MTGDLETNLTRPGLPLPTTQITSNLIQSVASGGGVGGE